MARPPAHVNQQAGRVKTKKKSEADSERAGHRWRLGSKCSILESDSRESMVEGFGAMEDACEESRWNDRAREVVKMKR